MLCCFTACNTTADKLNIPKEKQDFHFSVAQEEAAKVPYTLSGEKDDWKILIQVKKATEDEKKFALQLLKQQLDVIEENYSKNRVMTKEEYDLMCEKLEMQKKDISENDVYTTTITGQYTGEQEIQTKDNTLFYQIQTNEGKALYAAAQYIESLNSSLWYTSNNTVNGDYRTAMFIPPLEGCKVVLEYDNKNIEIPLTLSLES